MNRHASGRRFSQEFSAVVKVAIVLLAILAFSALIISYILLNTNLVQNFGLSCVMTRTVNNVFEKVSGWMLIPLVVTIIRLVLENKSTDSEGSQNYKKKSTLKGWIIIASVTSFVIYGFSSFETNAIEYIYQPEYEAAISIQTVDADAVGDESSPHFKVSYDDVLFSAYSYDELAANRSLLAEEIVLTLAAISDGFNAGSDIGAYKNCIDAVYDSERAYELYCEENLFDGVDDTERIDVLNRSVELRTDADLYYLDSENQRQISLRYYDLASERSHRSKSDSFARYEDCIRWGMLSLNTSFNEDSQLNRSKTLDVIIKAYGRLYDICPLNNSAARDKAALLKEIYEEIRYMLTI